MFSSIWIVVANSWQQTPAGFHLQVLEREGRAWLIDGVPQVRAEITDFWQLVFNPSTLHRLTHVLLGCFIMGAFFIMSISAWYVLKGKHGRFARRSFRGALTLATVASLAILLSGHFQARNVYEHQPAKLAAFEAHYETGPADLSIFGIPDSEEETVHLNVAIPGGLGFLLFEDPDGEVIGLDRFRPEDRPPVAIPFFSYRVMIGLGTFFVGLTLLASFLAWRKKLFDKRWIMWVFVFAVVPAVFANQAGWVAAEVGRQPWVVQANVVRGEDGQPVLDDEGHIRFEETELFYEDRDGAGHEVVRSNGLRTDEGISEILKSEQVVFSLVLFGLIYVMLGFVWVRVLHGKIRKRPEPIAGAAGDDAAPGDEGRE
jgi:cytochrome d ubiquinol oxidase subunit I